MKKSEAAFEPFDSLKCVFEAPKSAFFGIRMESRMDNFGNGTSGMRLKRIPKDPKTYYTAGGTSGEEEPTSFFINFEITNNQILCTTSHTGLFQYPCIYSRMVSAQRRGDTFMSQELLCGSPWGFGPQDRGRSACAASHDPRLNGGSGPFCIPYFFIYP
jgi:hypothetical protein